MGRMLLRADFHEPARVVAFDEPARQPVLARVRDSRASLVAYIATGNQVGFTKWVVVDEVGWSKADNYAPVAGACRF